jgi:radical SAM superfamily enzyme YgiQ (UPF0313 family)
MINGSKDSFFTTDYTDFHRLFIGIAILSVLICVICGEKAEYGCHNYISGCFFPDAFKSTQEYTRELIARHVSGRLKVAPEHTSDRVLNIMRKPPFSQFGEFKKIFDRINHEEGLRQQLIPYFISSHPGCKEEDMAELAVITKRLDFHLEQVQDFTPTPMTVATEAWYTGFHPYTLEPVFSAKTQREKLAQRQFFFWYKPEERRNIINELRRIGRTDLIDKLYGKR